VVSTRFYNSHRFAIVSKHEILLSRFDLPTFSPSMCICLFLKAEHCSAQTDDFCRVFGIGTSWNQCWNWYKLKPILKLGQVETNTEIGTSWNQYWNWYKLKPILKLVPVETNTDSVARYLNCCPTKYASRWFNIYGNVGIY